MRLTAAVLMGILSCLPAVATAQSVPSARAAFLDASQAGDLPRMKRLMNASVATMGQETITADRFLELIEGCPQSFVGEALISWKCGGDRPAVVTAVLKDGPERVSLEGLSIIAMTPAAGAGGQDG